MITVLYSFYNAHAATLKFSLENGGAGYSGVAANFYPWMHTWLCKHWKNQPQVADKVQQFLGLAETTIAHKVVIVTTLRPVQPSDHCIV